MARVRRRTPVHIYTHHQANIRPCQLERQHSTHVRLQQFKVALPLSFKQPIPKKAQLSKWAHYGDHFVETLGASATANLFELPDLFYCYATGARGRMSFLYAVISILNIIFDFVLQ